MKDEIKLTKLAKCAGCGAKVGAGILAQLLGDIRVHSDPNLLVGFDKSDDASVYKVSDELALVQTVDFFPPIADDPYVFGQIAATNALSDVYAMGGEPKLCLNIMAVPESMPKQTVHEILRGGYDKVYEAGALITGGHSIYDDEPKYGLAVTGFIHPDRILTNSGAKPGDVLFLTKPLGIGILTTAQKAELLSEDGKQLAQRLMTTLNKSARDAMVPFRLHGRDGLLLPRPRVRDGGRQRRAAKNRHGGHRPHPRGAGLCPHGHPARRHVPQPHLCRAHGRRRQRGAGRAGYALRPADRGRSAHRL